MQRESPWNTEASVICQHKGGYQIRIIIQRHKKDATQLRYIEVPERDGGVHYKEHPDKLPTLNPPGVLRVFEAACGEPCATMPDGWIVIELTRRPTQELIAELRVTVVVGSLMGGE